MMRPAFLSALLPILGLSFAACTDGESTRTTPRSVLGATIAVQPASDPIPCDGFAGLACPDGYVCVDDPTDDCDPDRGGADCAGICTLP